MYMGPIWTTRVWAYPYATHVEPGFIPHIDPGGGGGGGFSDMFISIYIGTLLRHSLTFIQRFEFYWLRIKDEIKENKDRQKKYIIIHKIYKCRIKMRRKQKYVSNL